VRQSRRSGGLDRRIDLALAELEELASTGRLPAGEPVGAAAAPPESAPRPPGGLEDSSWDAVTAIDLPARRGPAPAQSQGNGGAAREPVELMATTMLPLEMLRPDLGATTHLLRPPGEVPGAAEAPPAARAAAEPPGAPPEEATELTVTGATPAAGSWRRRVRDALARPEARQRLGLIQTILEEIVRRSGIESALLLLPDGHVLAPRNHPFDEETSASYDRLVTHLQRIWARLIDGLPFSELQISGKGGHRVIVRSMPGFGGYLHLLLVSALPRDLGETLEWGFSRLIPVLIQLLPPIDEP
jgi:hypothetical protein